MALKTQKIVGDSGSQEMAQVLHSYNHLLDVLYTLIDGLKTAADAPAINVLATTAEASLDSLVYKLSAKPNIPLSPATPAV